MRNKKKKNRENLNKFGVYAVGFLFLSSMVAIAMMQGTGSPQKVDLPQNPILQTPLDQNQIIYLSSLGGTYAEIKTTFCDFECLQTINQIEALTTTYTPYFYLYKNTTAQEQNIFIENYYGIVTLTNLTVEEIESSICEIIPGHPECIKRSAMNAVLTTIPTNTTN
ncbi:hypothetical protein GQ473_05430 [archaeon]|nr:hypothetical protein [archaeon]